MDLGWVSAALIAGLGTWLDLDQTFKIPRGTVPTAEFRLWWWGFILSHAVVVGALYGPLSQQLPVTSWPAEIRPVAVGLGFLALLRLKFVTIEHQNKPLPVGIETAYNRVKVSVYTRLNGIAREQRKKAVREKADQDSLKELGSEVSLHIMNDALLTEGQKKIDKQWLLSVLRDTKADDVERRRALAFYLLFGQRPQ